MHINLKNSIRSSSPPIKSFFDSIVLKRTSLKKTKITWKSTSEIMVEKVPEKRLVNFIQKMKKISKRYSFTRISKIEITNTLV